MRLINPKFSIIIPSFNSSLTIKTLIASLKSQIFTNFEIILIDAYSSDNTVNQMLDVFPDLVLHKRPPLGIWDALNFAIIQSRGEYLLTLNTDDFISSTFLAEANAYVESSKSKAFFMPTYSAGGFIKALKLERLCFGIGHAIHGHSACFVVAKSIHDSYGLYDIKTTYCADHKFYHALLQAGIIDKKSYCANPNRSAYGVFTDGGFSSSNPYIFKVVEEVRFRIFSANRDINDFIFCFAVSPCKILWGLFKKIIICKIR